MSRKSKTIVTLNLKMELPQGITIPILREAIKTELGELEFLGGPEPIKLNASEITLALVKKEVTYG